MKNWVMILICVTAGLFSADCPAEDAKVLGFRDLFNGKDLTGWVNVNTKEDTWSVKDKVLHCTGKPIGVMRTDRQYENFILELEWRHMTAGGNSGLFVWSEGVPPKGKRLPKGRPWSWQAGRLDVTPPQPAGLLRVRLTG